MELFNSKVNAKMSDQRRLDPSKVMVDIPVFTEEQWEHLEKVLLPLYLGGGLSIEYLLSQIPNVNVEQELERAASKDVDENERLKAENQRLKDDMRFQQLNQEIEEA